MKHRLRTAGLTACIRQLAERYDSPLPILVEEVGALAARVEEHLQAMEKGKWRMEAAQ